MYINGCDHDSRRWRNSKNENILRNLEIFIDESWISTRVRRPNRWHDEFDLEADWLPRESQTTTLPVHWRFPHECLHLEWWCSSLDDSSSSREADALVSLIVVVVVELPHWTVDRQCVHTTCESNVTYWKRSDSDYTSKFKIAFIGRIFSTVTGRKTIFWLLQSWISPTIRDIWKLIMCISSRNCDIFHDK